MLISPGVGYLYSATLSAWAGVTLVQNSSAAITGMDKTSRLWQQVIWRDYQSSAITLFSRTRLEESIATSNTPTAIRLRKKLVLTLTQQSSWRYRPEIADELMVNITKPAWLEDSNTIDQNRAFVGVLVKLTPHTSLEVGYLNQYQLVNSGNQMRHLLLANVNMTI